MLRYRFGHVGPRPRKSLGRLAAELSEHNAGVNPSLGHVSSPVVKERNTLSRKGIVGEGIEGRCVNPQDTIN